MTSHSYRKATLATSCDGDACPVPLKGTLIKKATAFENMTFRALVFPLPGKTHRVAAQAPGKLLERFPRVFCSALQRRSEAFQEVFGEPSSHFWDLSSLEFDTFSEIPRFSLSAQSGTLGHCRDSLGRTRMEGEGGSAFGIL